MTGFGRIGQYLACFGEIRGREFLLRSGMKRPGVGADFQCFAFMDWAPRVLSSLLWSSLIWSGAVWSVIINICILGQTGPGRARKDATGMKKTTPD